MVKVLEELAAGDYRDPGWYKHPAGTVAYEVDAAMAGQPARHKDAPSPGEGGMLAGMKMDHEHHH